MLACPSSTHSLGVTQWKREETWYVSTVYSGATDSILELSTTQITEKSESRTVEYVSSCTRERHQCSQEKHVHQLIQDNWEHGFDSSTTKTPSPPLYNNDHCSRRPAQRLPDPVDCWIKLQNLHYQPLGTATMHVKLCRWPTSYVKDSHFQPIEVSL